MLDYETTMRLGAEQYRDVLDALTDVGWLAEFTQTGGMNAALLVTLEAGATLLIGDQDDALSWAREESTGWGVAFYADPDRYEHSERFDGALAYEDTEKTDVSALLMMVERVVRAGTKELARRHRQAG